MRFVNINRKSSYEDVLMQIKEEFEIPPTEEARLANYDGKPVQHFLSFGDYMKHTKPQSYPRIYVITKDE